MQIDDIDVYKCREGRLDYRGLVSFAAIAVPMTVILMNEFVGDAILDAVIPGIYAAILVAGADLFEISVLALVLPFCVVVGVLCYLIFVYRPARNACNRRREKLKRVMGHEPIRKSKQFQQSSTSKYMQRSTFRVRTPSGYFRRVLVIIKHALQDGIAWLSCGEFRLRDPRKHQVQRDWCNLNMPARSQGIILEAPLATMTRQPSLSRMLADASNQPMFLPPIKISDMMTTATQWKALYVKHQKGLTGTNVADCLDEANQLVVTRPIPANDSIRKIKPLISFDPNDILTRISTQLTLSNPNQRDNLDSVKIVLLFKEFEKMLEVFYPDGIALTTLEKIEACELFNNWKEEHYLSRGLKGGDDAEVSFQSFESWFHEDLLRTFQRNMQERLIGHTLNCVPNVRKRLQKGVSSSTITTTAAAAADKLVTVEDVIPPTSKASPTRRRRTSNNILSFDSIYGTTEDVEVVSRPVSLKSASSSDIVLCRSKV